MATRWLNEAEMSGWRTFVNGLGPLMDALDRDLAPHGLTLGDYEVLVFLSEAPDQRLRMCDLAEKLRLSPSGLTRRLDGLARHHYVERQACPTDRRAVHAHLTDAGRRKLESAAPDHVASVRRHLIDRLPPGEVEHLATIFDAVRDGQSPTPQPA